MDSLAPILSGLSSLNPVTQLLGGFPIHWLLLFSLIFTILWSTVFYRLCCKTTRKLSLRSQPSNDTPFSSLPSTYLRPPPSPPVGFTDNETLISAFSDPSILDPESISHPFDLDAEDHENSQLAYLAYLRQPHRFISLATRSQQCHCCVCEVEISLLPFEPHALCLECTSRMCSSCFTSSVESYCHDSTFWTFETTDFWFGAVNSLKENSSALVLLRSLQHYLSRPFIGTRLSISSSTFSWLYSYRDALLSSVRICQILSSGSFLYVATMASTSPLARFRAICVWIGAIFAGVPFCVIQGDGSMSKRDREWVLGEMRKGMRNSSDDSKGVVFCEEALVEEVMVRGEEMIVLLDSSSSSSSSLSVDNSVILFEEFIGSEETEEEENENELLISTFTPPTESDPNDIICVIFTSGSTGFPKGVVYRESRFRHRLNRPSGVFPVVLLSYVPLSHIRGQSDVFLTILNGGRLGLLLNGDQSNLFADFSALRPTMLVAHPMLLVQIFDEFHRRMVHQSGNDEKRLVFEEMRRQILGDRLLKLYVGSAPCPIRIQRFIRRLLGCPLYDGYGSTECGAIALNWRFKRGVEFRLVPFWDYKPSDLPFPRGELLVKTKLTKGMEYLNVDSDGINKKLDENGFFPTKDIVEIRFDDDNILLPPRVIIIDRKNQVVKMLTGEFVSFERIEQILESSPLFDQVCVFTSIRKSALMALIVLSSSSLLLSIPEAKMEMERIAAETNQISGIEIPRFVRFCDAPFPVTGMQKKLRRRIERDHADLLSEMYIECDALEQSEMGGSLLSFISQLLWKKGPEEVDLDESFRFQGGTSTSAAALSGEIRIRCGLRLTQETIYSNSIRNLLQMVEEREEREGEREELKSNNRVSFETERQAMDLMLQELWREGERSHVMVPSTPERIFLTGASGFLGRFILRDLLRTFPDAMIVVLLRPRSAVLFREELLSKKETNRIEILEGDLGLPLFGLDGSVFESRIASCDLFIHAAAKVNHFASLSDHYAVNVESLFDLVRLTCGWKPLVYVSSLSVLSLRHCNSPINTSSSVDLTEIVHRDWDGYPASKWIADCVLQLCCSSNCSIVRPPLICGSSVTGECNRADWLNRALHDMLSVGCIPSENRNADTPINMLSVDAVARAVVRTAEKTIREGGQPPFTIQFPNVTVGELLESVAGFYEETHRREIRRVPIESWIDEMVAMSHGGIHDLRMAPFLVNAKQRGMWGPRKFEVLGIEEKIEQLEELLMGDNRCDHVVRLAALTKDELVPILSNLLTEETEEDEQQKKKCNILGS